MSKSTIAELLSYPTVTPAELQLILRAGQNSVYDSIRSGQTPHFLIGRNIRIPTAWVRAQLGLTTEAA